MKSNPPVNVIETKSPTNSVNLACIFSNGIKLHKENLYAILNW